MKIVCVADLHQNLVEIPECDLLLIAGDITYGFNGVEPALHFLHTDFKSWLSEVPAREIVVVAGNHDVAIEAYGWPEDLDCHYLEDQSIELLGLKIWGSPWQPYFFDWAFNAPEHGGESFLKEKFDLIPDDTDILICHGPPYGYGDRVGSQDNPTAPRVGSRALADALRRVNPRLMVCGHIHAGTGTYQLHGKRTQIINAAMVNEEYQLKCQPFEIELT